MPRPCDICVHPKVAELDEQLTRGLPVPLLAERYSVSADALGRHRARHLGHSKKLRGNRFGQSASMVIDDLVALKEIADLHLEQVGDDKKAAASLIREIRGIDESIAKIRGFDRQVHDECVSTEELENFTQLILIALKPFPEALNAVRQAINFEKEGMAYE